MPDYERSVFISYAWGEENEKIVNQLDQSLQGRGMKIIRDKRDLEYTGSIKNFMERIGTGDCVIVVISDKYLKSPNCMFELVEIAGNKQFEKRIFPVVLADADIYKIKGKFQYIKHWEEQIKELKEMLKEVDPTNLQDIYDQLNLYDRIRDNISRLTGILSDMNALTPEMHSNSGFNQLYAAIENRMKERPARPIPEILVPDFEREDYEPETILIPDEGAFLLGSEPGEGVKDYDMPRHPVSLPAYRISKYPVLNREYAEFITQSGTQVSAPLVGFNGLNPKRGLEDQPVKGVTLEDVRAYCKWLSEMTKRKYDVPNEAQLEKAYQGPYGCSDIIDDIYLWTCTLWGENISPPDFKYPWKNDGRNNPNANSQIRRVVCRYKKVDGTDRSQRHSRSGQFPKQPLSPERYSFRVVMNF